MMDGNISDAPILIRHRLVPAKFHLMLLPLGQRFNRRLATAPMGSICQVGETGELCKIISRAILPLKHGDKNKFSPIAEALSIAIYGKKMQVVYKFMAAGWERYIEDEELLFLGVEKVGDGSDEAIEMAPPDDSVPCGDGTNNTRGWMK